MERPMKIKVLLAALALTAAPSFAMAMGGCGFGHAKAEDVAMSCAEGTVYDSEAQRCVVPTG